MFTTSNRYAPDRLAFRTEAVSLLSYDHRCVLDALRDMNLELWKQMILCHEAKTVMVVNVGGYRATPKAVMQLLQSAHALGVPVLLVPYQEGASEIVSRDR